MRPPPDVVCTSPLMAPSVTGSRELCAVTELERQFAGRLASLTVSRAAAAAGRSGGWVDCAAGHPGTAVQSRTQAAAGRSGGWVDCAAGHPSTAVQSRTQAAAGRGSRPRTVSPPSLHNGKSEPELKSSVVPES